MKAEIFSIGHELLRGEVTDTNASYLASQLTCLGIEVRRIAIIGDDLEDLAESLRWALGRSHLILTTGGLGPTQDDLTREAIARVLGEELRVQDGLLEELKEHFKRRGYPMPSQNVKQAALIPSAQAIPNPRGTAPGWWVEHGGSILVAMPGPPSEMTEMWQGRVLPRLKDRIVTQATVTRTIKTSGLTEAAVAELVAPLFGRENPYLGIYARPDGIHLRIIARGDSEEKARALVRPLEEDIRKPLYRYIWGYDDETPATSAGHLLREQGLTLAVMESCTGGLLASSITDVPGSSAYFKGGIVSYTDEVKTFSGVEAALIQAHGAVSREVSLAMARAVRDRLGADVGIGVTGVAGPTEVEGKPVGTVHVAIAGPGGQRHYPLRLPPRREVVKRRAVSTALIELARYLRTA